MMKKKTELSYYVCPYDGTYSGEMELVEKVKLSQIGIREKEALKGFPPIDGERLQCPKCGRIFGWHQLKEVVEK